MAKPKSKTSGQLGCSFLFGTGLVMVILLCLNSMFVKVFFGANLANLDERFFNAAQFMLPIIMIFIEFWLYDAVRDYIRFRRNQAS